GGRGSGRMGIGGVGGAEEKDGKGKPVTGTQVQWALENFNLTAERIKELGFEGMLGPVKLSCADHEGAQIGRVHQWDGAKWVIVSDFITADRDFTHKMYEEAA